MLLNGCKHCFTSMCLEISLKLRISIFEFCAAIEDLSKKRIWNLSNFHRDIFIPHQYFHMNEHKDKNVYYGWKLQNSSIFSNHAVNVQHNWAGTFLHLINMNKWMSGSLTTLLLYFKWQDLCSLPIFRLILWMRCGKSLVECVVAIIWDHLPKEYSWNAFVDQQ